MVTVEYGFKNEIISESAVFIAVCEFLKKENLAVDAIFDKSQNDKLNTKLLIEFSQFYHHPCTS